MKEVISLKDLLDTTFTINDKGEMVGEFTLKRINMIGDILTNYYEENDRLNTNWKVAVEDLTRIAKLLDLEESCSIYDIEDKIKELKGSDKE